MALAVGGWLALAGTADAQAPADQVVPRAAGMMGAVEAPVTEDEASALPLLFQASGAVLLAGGALTAARSWVSPARPG